jgi:hypothetical protein
MAINHPDIGRPPGKPEPIPFSLTLPHQALEGSIAIRPHLTDPHLVAVELQLAGIGLGSAALTEEGALDLALRLVGVVMNQRRRHEREIACAERCRSTVV